MRLKHVFIAVFGLAAICPTQGWSQTADVFPSFGPDKEVVSGASEDFRGGAAKAKFIWCTDFVYSLTGIKTGMGDAYQWIQTANKRSGYTVSPNPTNNSVGVIGKCPTAPGGHVYWVQTVGLGPEFSMYIRHANWETPGVESVYHTAMYWGGRREVQIKQKNWTANMPSLGFITKWKK